MAASFDYSKKFQSFQKYGLYGLLAPEQQKFIRDLAFAHRFTFQEFREIVEFCRDLAMWGEGDLKTWWQAQVSRSTLQGAGLKHHLLQKLKSHIQELKRSPKNYPPEGLPRPQQRERYLVSTKETDKKIHGLCPVASEDTVCCNLRTIDAVENCVFGCSYCTIQSFYSDEFVFDAHFAEKLKEIALAPDRFYHFGTGQSSDSLAWGNRNGILDALCLFASNHPNVLLEFKTKSNNIRYFLQLKDVPENIVCSWTLNPPTIIRNEEHFTASLDERITAARLLVEKGMKVAFHFHPMLYYRGWEKEYPEIAEKLMLQFQPADVLFVSFGSVTMIKPAMAKIRKLGHSTKTLQMEMAPDPHGKLTYPDEIKIKMFTRMYETFRPWREEVFMYLCMEKASIWEKIFGYVYKDNDEFELDFGRKIMSKLASRRKSQSILHGV